MNYEEEWCEFMYKNFHKKVLEDGCMFMCDVIYCLP